MSEEVEVQTTTRNDMKHSNALIEAATNRERWIIMENDYATRHEEGTLLRTESDQHDT